MNSWILPTLLLVMISAGWHWRLDLRHQLLGERAPIPRAALFEESMGLQFRFGTIPDSQNQALERLKSLNAVRQKRLQDGGFQVDVSEAVTRELTVWKKQWENDEERQTRLVSQHRTEAEMETYIRENLLDEAWLEARLQTASRFTMEELSREFARQKDVRYIPPVWRVAHLFLIENGPDAHDRSAQIKSLRQRLAQGESWETLVQAHSEDSRSKARKGDLGWVASRQIMPEFFEALQRLRVGDVSSPVKTRLGWHLIRVLEHRPARQATLDEARSELTASLAHIKREAGLARLTFTAPTSIRR